MDKTIGIITKFVTIAVTAVVLSAVLFVMAACSQRGVEHDSGSDSSSEMASVSSATDIDKQSDSPGNDGMKAVAIDDETMGLITGTWQVKGVWFDASDPIESLDGSKNLQDQYGQHSITFNADKTFKYQKRNGLEEGVWEYYGEDAGMRNFAMKVIPVGEASDGGDAATGESDLQEAIVYYVYLYEGDDIDFVVVHKQGNSIEDAKPVMVKTSGSDQATANGSRPDDSSAVDRTVTTGERNALDKAKSYLAMTAFSYSGLVEQLEFEGFTHEEAVYGADGCGANWNEQAARKAQQYLDMMSFSRAGLIEQLEFEGFTHSQAEYGVSKAY